jgi:predicted nucleic acid-binding protein
LNPPFVADASVAVAWAVPSQSSSAADRLLDQVVEGSGIAVPSIWPYEVANVLLKVLRRKTFPKEDYLAARKLLAGLRPAIDDESTRIASTRIADLALDYGLSVYDAAYLELATRKQLALASRDAALNRAAASCGVRLLL